MTARAIKNNAVPVAPINEFWNVGESTSISPGSSSDHDLQISKVSFSDGMGNKVEPLDAN